jgi:hypothetical protein
MMYTPPDALTSGLKGITTNAVANVLNTDTVVAAPGAGKRLRIWAASLMVNTASGGDYFTLLRDSSGNAWTIAVIGLSDEMRTAERLFPGGILLQENRPLEVHHRCTAASQTFYVVALYTIEDV